VTLEQLAWSGACDGLLAGEGARVGADRRSALWQLGLASPAVGIEGGSESERKMSQLALPLELPEAPPLRKLGRWQRLIADYSTSGVTVGDHAMAVLRERLTAHRLATSAQLTRLPSGCEIALAGLVIARQRPGTANGTMFLLFEDEFGTVNLIVPREVYERRRHLARAEPLLLARGRLERHQEGTHTVLRRGEESGTLVRDVTEADGERIRPVINLLVRELEPLDRYLDGALAEPGSEGAIVRRLETPTAPGAEPAERRPDGAEVGSSLRAVAPPIQSFASGRRR
jgi:error-prone DNA polymerase